MLRLQVLVSLIVTMVMAGGLHANLINGDFEAYGVKSLDQKPLENWVASSLPVGSPYAGFEDLKYNGTTHWDPSREVYDGNNFATLNLWAARVGEYVEIKASQTVSMPAGTVQLSGAIIAGTTLDPDDFTHFINIRDGRGTLASFELPGVDGGTDWVPFTIYGTTDGSGVTVEWGFRGANNTTTVNPIVTTHVDGLTLTPEPATFSLLALGVVPLLRRRR